MTELNRLQYFGERLALYLRQRFAPRHAVLGALLVLGSAHLLLILFQPWIVPGSDGYVASAVVRGAVDSLAVLLVPIALFALWSQSRGRPVLATLYSLVLGLCLAVLLQSAALASLASTGAHSSVVSRLVLESVQPLRIFWHSFEARSFATAAVAYLRWLQLALALLAITTLLYHLRLRPLSVHRAYFNFSGDGSPEFAFPLSVRPEIVHALSGLRDGLRVLVYRTRPERQLRAGKQSQACTRQDYAMLGPVQMQTAVPPFTEIWTADVFTESMPGSRPRLASLVKDAAPEFVYPKSLEQIFANLRRSGNPYGFERDAFRPNAAVLPTSSSPDADECPIDLSPDAGYLLWSGAELPFSRRGQVLLQTIAAVLAHAGVAFRNPDFTYSCTGYPARVAGNEALYQELRDQNLRAIEASGAHSIITPCLQSAYALREVYGAGLRVFHTAEFFLTLLHGGQLVLDGTQIEQMQNRRATLQRSAAGIPILPAETTARLARYCLGCDASDVADPKALALGPESQAVWAAGELEAYLASRMGTLVDTGADLIITNSPDWLFRMRAYLDRAGMSGEIQLLDVCELVAASMRDGYGALPGGFAAVVSSA